MTNINLLIRITLNYLRYFVINKHFFCLQRSQSFYHLITLDNFFVIFLNQPIFDYVLVYTWLSSLQEWYRRGMTLLYEIYSVTDLYVIC